ncbi:unnamed protein product, partial [Brachionus calyciflorus]
MIEYYIKYKESGFSAKEKADYNNAKREFRAKKRLNIKLKRDRSLKNLSGLFKVDKISFWKKIKSMSNKEQLIDIDIADIREDYIKQFNERISRNSPNEQKNNMTLKNFLSFFENRVMDYSLNSEVIKEIIENLPNGKSIGIGGVSYEMLKYSSND